MDIVDDANSGKVLCGMVNLNYVRFNVSFPMEQLRRSLVIRRPAREEPLRENDEYKGGGHEEEGEGEGEEEEEGEKGAKAPSLARKKTLKNYRAKSTSASNDETKGDESESADLNAVQVDMTTKSKMKRGKLSKSKNGTGRSGFRTEGDKGGFVGKVNAVVERVKSDAKNNKKGVVAKKVVDVIDKIQSKRKSMREAKRKGTLKVNKQGGGLPEDKGKYLPFNRAIGTAMIYAYLDVNKVVGTQEMSERIFAASHLPWLLPEGYTFVYMVAKFKRMMAGTSTHTHTTFESCTLTSTLFRRRLS